MAASSGHTEFRREFLDLKESSSKIGKIVKNNPFKTGAVGVGTVVAFLGKMFFEEAIWSGIASAWNWSTDEPALALFIALVGGVGVIEFDRSKTNRRRKVELDRRAAVIAIMRAWFALQRPISQQVAADQDISEGVIAFADQFLSDLPKVIDPANPVQYRASIWIPREDGRFLRPFASYKMGSDSLRDDRFFIGNGNQHKPGVAGIVYKTGRTVLVHIQNGVSDNPDFTPSAGESTMHQYAAFIAIPISLSVMDSTLGVLCIDSHNVDTFDSSDVKQALEQLTEPLATMIALQTAWNYEGERKGM